MLNMSFFIKELKEIIKTKKLVIMVSLFIFFAILSPLTARYINEILASLGQGVSITLPEPTLIDSWGQYFKNLSSICLIVYLIVMTGSVSHEKSKGSILLVMTKRVSRFNFLFSKLLSGILLFTVCYIISFVISGFYTNILFGSYTYDGLWISLLLMWFMGVFFTSLANFASVISKSPTISAIYGFVGLALITILNVIPKFSKFSPAGGAMLVTQIMLGIISQNDSIINLAFATLGTILLFAITYFIFRKQEI